MSLPRFVKVDQATLATVLVDPSERTIFHREQQFLEWAQNVPMYAAEDPTVRESIRNRVRYCLQDIIWQINLGLDVGMPTHSIERPGPDDLKYIKEEGNYRNLRIRYDGSIHLDFAFPQHTARLDCVEVTGILNTASPYLLDVAERLMPVANPGADGALQPRIRKTDKRGDLVIGAIHHVWRIDARLGKLRTKLQDDGYYPDIKRLEAQVAGVGSQRLSPRAQAAAADEYQEMLETITHHAAYQDLFRFEQHARVR